MSRPVIAIVIFVTTVVATAYFVAQVCGVAARLGLLGRTGERHIRGDQVPRIGGVGIFLGFCVGVAVSFALPVLRFPEEVTKIVLMLVGSLLICVVMLADDLIELPALPRLLWQFGGATLVVSPLFFDRWRNLPRDLHSGALLHSGIYIQSIPNPFAAKDFALPLLIAVPLTLVWIVGMTNAINWIDGVDGLSSGIVIISCAVLFIHTYFRLHQFTIALLPLALGAAALGFLPFNWHPSKIIMGDSGAMFLGYALAVISIIGGAKIATTVLVLIVPILNALWAVLSRIARRTNPMRADQSHLHYRLLAAGMSPPQITLAAYAVCAVAGVFALLFSKQVKFFFFAGLGVTLLVVLVLLAVSAPRRIVTDWNGSPREDAQDAQGEMVSLQRHRDTEKK